MINYTIINKAKSKTVIFVHGLFANSGYWLPHLTYFRDYRLIILNIDYQFFDEVEQYVERITKIIEAEAGGVVDAIISHSLGTLITHKLSDTAYRALFEVCPVYCASRINTERFIGEIQKKIRCPLSDVHIKEMLDRIDRLMVRNFIYKNSLIRSITYYPNADLYFSYNFNDSAKIFKGDHFDISEAMLQIQDELSI